MAKKLSKPKGDEDFESLEGRLLISTSRTGGGPFQRAVVLMCTHGSDGAMGLIVNAKCKEPQFTDLLEAFDIEAKIDVSEIPVYFGGPVETARGFVIHGMDFECDGTAEVTDEIRVSVAQFILSEIAAGRGPKQVVCAMGYAGWAPGQLEKELQLNQWMCGDAWPDVIFADSQADKWGLAMEQLGLTPAMLTTEGGQA